MHTSVVSNIEAELFNAEWEANEKLAQEFPNFVKSGLENTFIEAVELVRVPLRDKYKRKFELLTGEVEERKNLAAEEAIGRLPSYNTQFWGEYCDLSHQIKQLDEKPDLSKETREFYQQMVREVQKEKADQFSKEVVQKTTEFITVITDFCAQQDFIEKDFDYENKWNDLVEEFFDKCLEVSRPVYSRFLLG